MNAVCHARSSVCRLHRLDADWSVPDITGRRCDEAPERGVPPTGVERVWRGRGKAWNVDTLGLLPGSQTRLGGAGRPLQLWNRTNLEEVQLAIGQ